MKSNLMMRTEPAPSFFSRLFGTLAWIIMWGGIMTAYAYVFHLLPIFHTARVLSIAGLSAHWSFALLGGAVGLAFGLITLTFWKRPRELGIGWRSFIKEPIAVARKPARAVITYVFGLIGGMTVGLIWAAGIYLHLSSHGVQLVSAPIHHLFLQTIITGAVVGTILSLVWAALHIETFEPKTNAANPVPQLPTDSRMPRFAFNHPNVMYIVGTLCTTILCTILLVPFGVAFSLLPIFRHMATPHILGATGTWSFITMAALGGALLGILITLASPRQRKIAAQNFLANMQDNLLKFAKTILYTMLGGMLGAVLGMGSGYIINVAFKIGMANVVSLQGMMFGALFGVTLTLIVIAFQRSPEDRAARERAEQLSTVNKVVPDAASSTAARTRSVELGVNAGKLDASKHSPSGSTQSLPGPVTRGLLETPAAAESGVKRPALVASLAKLSIVTSEAVSHLQAALDEGASPKAQTPATNTL